MALLFNLSARWGQVIHHGPVALLPGKTRYPLKRRWVWVAPGPVWVSAEPMHMNLFYNYWFLMHVL
jgi:hypothetical protein